MVNILNMSSSKFKCPKCGKVVDVSFETGEKPVAPTCDDCKETMKRQFTNIEVGDVVDDMMMHFGHTMLYS